MRYGSNGRPWAGISWSPASRSAFRRLSRTIRTPSPAVPSSRATAASSSSTTGRRRARSVSWANFRIVSVSRSARLRKFSNSAWRYLSRVSSSSFSRRSSAASSRLAGGADGSAGGGPSRCRVGVSSAMLRAPPHAHLVPPPARERRIEHAVPVRGRDGLRFDGVPDVDLPMEDAAVGGERVDRQAGVGRGDLEGLLRRAGEFERDVNPVRRHDDIDGTGLDVTLVRDRGRRPEDRDPGGRHRREAPVRVEAPQKAVDVSGGIFPLAGRIGDHGDHPRAPGRGPQNSSPSPPPSPPSPPLLGPLPPPSPALAAMTSSMRRIMTAASAAEEIAWLPTRIGSITFSFFMSETLPEKTLIPAYLLPFLCSFRSSIRMSIGSRPAFSAKVRGIASTASAKASIAICSRPPTLDA